MYVASCCSRGAIIVSLLLIVCRLCSPAWSAPVAAKLATGGKALLPVVVSEQASDEVKTSAHILADYLQKISGAAFEVKTGDGARGLAVGVYTDFPAVKSGAPFDTNDPTKREDYLLRSHAAGVYLLGTTALAVQHAVWDVLYRLGHRQFFPNATWEIIPRISAPSLAVDSWESPDFHTRRIWYEYGNVYNAEEYRDWCAKNRAVGGIALNSGHAYSNIISVCKAEITAHPEYLALVKDPKTGETKRGGDKFCIANPGLRQMVAEYAVKKFAANPAIDSLSLEPSDGGGWCECADCAKMGSVSDRVVMLANEAAEAVNKQFPGKYIGIYAYYQHSPPPTVKVHPNVVVSIATAFITGGYTLDQLLDGWSAKCAMIGIRDFYSCFTWNHDLPGSASATNLARLQQNIPHFYAKGVRFNSSQATDSWGPCGLGYYFAARMLWDVKEADKREAMLAEFFEKCFGPAQKPMKDFYQRISGEKPQLMSEDLIARMYRDLQTAKALTNDANILARVHDLILYTKYVDLFYCYSSATGEARQQAFEQLIRFGYRIRKTGMIHTLSLYRDQGNRDKMVSFPPNCEWKVPDEKNPWKQNPPVTREEVEAMLTEGIARNKLIDFTPVAYSRDLIPPSKLHLPPAPDSMPVISARFAVHLYTWMPEEQGKLNVEYYGNGRIFSLESPKHALPDAMEEFDLRKAEIVPRDAFKPVTFTTPYQGVHVITAAGNRDGTVNVRMQDSRPMTVPASDVLAGRWYLYFYVPKGTKVVGGYADSRTGEVWNGSGKKVFDFTKDLEKPGYFSIPVAEGQDGKLWKMHFCAGQRILMTVPPYYARNAEELLLPREVVEQDAPK